jgi:hypothetical protein
MIRKIFEVPGYLISKILAKTQVTFSSLLSISYLIALITVVSFYLIFKVSTLRPEWFEIFTIIGLLASAIVYEVLENFAKTDRVHRHSILLDRYTDVMIISGTIYVVLQQSYGIAPYLTQQDLIFLGLAIFLGIIFLDIIGWRKKKRAFMSARSERLAVLAIFLAGGYYYRNYESGYIAGLSTLAALIYISFFKENIGVGKAIAEGVIRSFYTLVVLLYQGATLLLKDLSRLRRLPSAEEEVPSEYEEEPEPIPGYHFTAVVTNGRSEPIANVEVSLDNVETGKKDVKYTDNQGRADFYGIEGGHYRIRIEAEGFDTKEYERYISMDSGEVFTLTKPYSDLSIVITDKNKTTPVPNAKVTIKHAESGKVKVSKNADNLGVAYFDNLEIDTYDVEVEAKGYKRWGRRINLVEENVVAVNLAKESEEDKLFEEVEVEKPESEIPLEELLGECVLIEYSQPGDVEKIVIDIVEKHLRDNRDVYLVPSQLRINKYRERFGDNIRMISLPLSSSKPLTDEKISEIPMTNLEYFKAVYEEMSAGSVLIFEPLSSLVMNLGFEPAYKFVSESLEYLIGEGLSLICLLNITEHDEKVIASFRDLFNLVAHIKDGRLILP